MPPHHTQSQLWNGQKLMSMPSYQPRVWAGLEIPPFIHLLIVTGCQGPSGRLITPCSGESWSFSKVLRMRWVTSFSVFHCSKDRWQQGSGWVVSGTLAVLTMVTLAVLTMVLRRLHRSGNLIGLRLGHPECCSQSMLKSVYCVIHVLVLEERVY